MVKVGPVDIKDLSSHNTVDRKVKSKGKHALQFQRMESESPDDDFEERDVTMLRHPAQAAMERRRGANTPDNSQGFSGHGGDQPQGNLLKEGRGQVTGDANGPSGVDAPSASTAPIDNKRLRAA